MSRKKTGSTPKSLPEPAEERIADLEARQREFDAATKEHYDSASDEELAEEREWAEMTAPTCSSTFRNELAGVGRARCRPSAGD